MLPVVTHARKGRLMACSQFRALFGVALRDGDVPSLVRLVEERKVIRRKIKLLVLTFFVAV
jgi:hypothetical protein